MIEQACIPRHARPDEPVVAINLWRCLACGDRWDDTIGFYRAMAKPETRAQRNARIMRELQFSFAEV